MGTFVHDLIDPGANWCPVCGEMRGVCTCTDEDYGFMTEEEGNRWAHEILYGEEDRQMERLRREHYASWWLYPSEDEWDDEHGGDYDDN